MFAPRRAALAALLSLLLCHRAIPPAGADESGEAGRILKVFASEFVAIEPGKGGKPASVTLGGKGPGEQPATEVRLTRPFHVAKYEVTQELYALVMGSNPSRWKGPRNSVEMTSWDDAVTFCRKVTPLLRERKLLSADEEVRLPSEAEWEYCCRAGTTTAYSFGDEASKLGEYGWFSGNAKGNDPPVGKKKPNPWGLYDMHGYIWEWCADGWSPTHAGVPADGAARQIRDARQRVVRGGSWADGADRATSSARAGKAATFTSDAVGFRCVRSKVAGEGK